jgi:hypothetical protein
LQYPRDDEVGRLSRQYAAKAMKSFAEMADNPAVDPQIRELARQELEKCLSRLKELEDDPKLPAKLRTALEATKREFFSS